MTELLHCRGWFLNWTGMAALEFPWQQRKAALIVAHPGHELRVHHWMELARPLVLVLTDGSGRTAQSRLSSTTRILRATGARAGSVYGRFKDAEIYAAILHGGQEALTGVMREVARILEGEGIGYVAHDAVEGYNPSHDLCAHLAGAAALLAGKMQHREVRRFDFLLTGPPDECPAQSQAGAIRVALDDAALARKFTAAETYPELKMAVDAAIGKFGASSFATEWLRPVTETAVDLSDAGAIPFYESHGAARRAGGHYADVIRRREHVLPLARSLWKIAAGD